jgi:hypothetical protein
MEGHAMLDYEECRPYVAHLIAEHRRLHAMLHQARAAIVHSGGPDRDASVDDIVRVLRHIRSELAHHFAEEEAGGCMDEAVSCCPRLSAEVKRIEAEHPELLLEIDRLIAQALDTKPSVAHVVALERGFDHLCQQLCAHEAAENGILRQAFGINVNGEEAEQPAIHDF